MWRSIGTRTSCKSIVQWWTINSALSVFVFCRFYSFFIAKSFRLWILIGHEDVNIFISNFSSRFRFGNNSSRLGNGSNGGKTNLSSRKFISFSFSLKITKQNLVEFPFKLTEKTSSGKEKGLSELVRLCFGKGLDKSEQCSNWEKRPLRDAQRFYAATDAACLLDLYRFLRDELHVPRDFLQSFRGRKPNKSNESKSKTNEDETSLPIDSWVMMTTVEIHSLIHRIFTLLFFLFFSVCMSLYLHQWYEIDNSFNYQMIQF